MNIATARIIESIRLQHGEFAGDAVDAARREFLAELDFALDAIPQCDFERIDRVLDKARAILKGAGTSIWQEGLRNGMLR